MATSRSVECIWGEGSQVIAKGEKAQMVMGQSEVEGGLSGVSPMEALLAALGGCKGMVARSLAKRMNIELDEFKLVCEGEMNEETHQYTKILCHFHIKTKTSKEQIEEFLEKVEKLCPVHLTLEGGPELAHDLHYNE